MSQIIKLNLSLILAVIACGGAIFSAVGAITRRDQDVRQLQQGFNEMKTEFRAMRDSRNGDRETLIAIQRDLQWMVEQKKAVAR